MCDTISVTYKAGASEVVLVNTSDVLEGKCLNHIKVPNKNLKGQFKKTFQKDDILYSEIRPANKRYAYVDFDATNYIASTKLMVLRAKEGINSRYLYQILRSNSTLEQLQMLAESRSGTFPQITYLEMANIRVGVPSKEAQDKIVNILSSLDRKIELNNKINATLEEMAQALFKSWFVDFDPFKNGNFIDTEIGKIPEGWRVAELGEFMPIKTGKKDANVASTNGTYPFFSCSQGISWTNDYSFEGCAILVAGNGDFNVKWYKGKFEAYQRTYVLIPYEEKLTHLLFYAIKFYLKQITQGARGSVIKFITKGNLQNFKIACPQDIANHEIATRFCAINEQIRVNSQQSLTLTHLRDTLLPRLMSGEIEV